MILLDHDRLRGSSMTASGGDLSAHDGLAVRDSGRWAKEKLYYVDRYMTIFNGGMKNMWPRRGYIDLMSGPGRCIDRKTGEEFDGSPLLALKSAPPFSHAVFVESDSAYASALATRTSTESSRRTVLTSDCNAPRTITEVRQRIEARMLSLCFVDNLGLNVTFNTISTLVQDRSIDLLFTFQVSDLTRNVDEAMNSPDGERFDAFLAHRSGGKSSSGLTAESERDRIARQPWQTSMAGSSHESVTRISINCTES